MTEKRGGRENQSSRSFSLGSLDPRARRQPQSATTDLDIEYPLAVQTNGKIGLDLSGALAIENGKLVIRTSNGLKIAPGSPVSLQLDIDDDSLEITGEGRVRSRPRASQVRIDSNSAFVGNKTLKEALDNEVELLQRKGQANGYCELDSSSMIPAARVPFSAIPTELQLLAINDLTYDLNVHRFLSSGSGAEVNYLTSTNSDTGSPVIISADGTDTDIGIDITAKGLGLVRANGSRVETYSNKNIAGGYAGLDGSSKVAPAQLPVFTSVADGAAPASGGGTTNFLRADGTWAAPGGGGGGSGLDQPAVMARMAFGGF
jgi:hypothetical protein